MYISNRELWTAESFLVSKATTPSFRREYRFHMRLSYTVTVNIFLRIIAMFR
jgi:hypothetical protein